MRINELIELLQEVKSSHGGDLQVVIQVYRRFSIGSTPYVDIDDIYAGIDWNHGKVFLHPADKLEIVEK